MDNTSSSADPIKKTAVVFRLESNKFYLMTTSDVLRGIA
jgi:hypothetical protein